MRQLEAPADVPDFPPEFHQILVHLVVRGYATSVGAKDLARTHQAFADELLEAMEGQHLARSSQRHLRHTMLAHDRASLLLQAPGYTSDA